MPRPSREKREDKGKTQYNLRNCAYREEFTKEKLLRIDLTEQRPFINLVDSILKAKSANPKADTTEQEAKIDRLVYQLYDLTPTELTAVENI